MLFAIQHFAPRFVPPHVIVFPGLALSILSLNRITRPFKYIIATFFACLLYFYPPPFAENVASFLAAIATPISYVAETACLILVSHSLGSQIAEKCHEIQNANLWRIAVLMSSMLELSIALYLLFNVFQIDASSSLILSFLLLISTLHNVWHPNGVILSAATVTMFSSWAFFLAINSESVFWKMIAIFLSRLSLLSLGFFLPKFRVIWVSLSFLVVDINSTLKLIQSFALPILSIAALQFLEN